MFSVAKARDLDPFDDWSEEWEATLEGLKAELRSRQSEISRLQAEQIELLRQADRLQADTAEGALSLADWTSATLDVTHRVASRLCRLAQGSHRDLEAGMAEGSLGLERAHLLAKLRAVGADDELISGHARYSLSHLGGLWDRLRRVDADAEALSYEARYLVLQPCLDLSAYKIWGQLPGTDGQVVERALERREGTLPALEDQTKGQRAADALVSVCLDSLTQGGGGRAAVVAEVFVDATVAAPTRGEAGASLSSGPRVGPDTLSEILCSGKVRVIALGEEGLPIGASHLGEAVPPAVRSYVIWRDQGRCVIEGCRSRYRLQVHHLRERGEGGGNHPDNLVSLCWYHHHVAIHGMGMRIDPDSPPGRRRLIWGGNHDPPG